MTTYLEKLKDPRWQKLKALVHMRDDWTCQECGAVHKTLVAHHRRYSAGDPWDVAFEDLVTLCWDCHGKLHSSDSRLVDSTIPITVDSVLSELVGYSAFPKLLPSGEVWVRGAGNVPAAVMSRARQIAGKIREYLERR